MPLSGERRAEVDRPKEEDLHAAGGAPAAGRRRARRKPSPTWVPATAVGLIIFAIVWLVVYYLTGQWFDLGESFTFLAELSYWNLAIGFGAMIAALAVLSKWR